MWVVGKIKGDFTKIFKTILSVCCVMKLYLKIYVCPELGMSVWNYACLSGMAFISSCAAFPSLTGSHLAKLVLTVTTEEQEKVHKQKGLLRTQLRLEPSSPPPCSFGQSRPQGSPSFSSHPQTGPISQLRPRVCAIAHSQTSGGRPCTHLLMGSGDKCGR